MWQLSFKHHPVEKSFFMCLMWFDVIYEVENFFFFDGNMHIFIGLEGFFLDLLFLHM